MTSQLLTPQTETALDLGLRLGLDAPWETNAQGQLIVNPPIGIFHARHADRLIDRLKSGLPGWQIWPEIGIHTADGLKAPDLTAASPNFPAEADHRGFLLRAPELCVEIMSPSNTWEEMRHKVHLYLDAGAREAWVCDEAGRLYYFAAEGELGASRLVPAPDE